MRTPTALSLVALLAPMAAANGTDELDLSRVNVPALKAVEVSAKPGKGVTFDAGDDFKLTIGNRAQVLWQFSALDNANADVNTFRVRRARTKFKGHVFSPKTRYQLQVEWATGGSNLLDAWIQRHYDLGEGDWDLHARLGAGKTQYGREATGTSAGLELVERSLAARTFSGVRQVGAIVGVKGAEDKFRAHVAAFNSSTAGGATLGQAQNQLNNHNELNFSAGARYDFKADMGAGESYKQGDLARSEEWNASLGAGVWIGNDRPAGGPDFDILAFNVNGVFVYQGFHALGEFFYHTAEADVSGAQSSDNTGFNFQGSYVFEGGEWGLAARISGVMIDDQGFPGVLPTSGGTTGGGTGLGTPAVGLPAGDVMEYSFGVNKFFNGHAQKVQADVTFQQVDNDAAALLDDDNIIFRIMATLSI